MHDQLSEVAIAWSENPTWYQSSGSTGSPRTYRIRWEDIAASSRLTMPTTVLLGFPVRTYAGLQVLAYVRRHRCPLLAPNLTDLADSLPCATHLSVTPTLLHRLLMQAADFSTIRQITLGGEYARQALLDEIKMAAPQARITQIYASSENGVCASWSDGLEGIPENRWNETRAVRSDKWERRNGRWYFHGRMHDFVNVAGHTVNIADIESALYAVPGMQYARVYARRSMMTGCVILAEIAGSPDEHALRQVLDRLPPISRPRFIARVQEPSMALSGKKLR